MSCLTGRSKVWLSRNQLEPLDCFATPIGAGSLDRHEVRDRASLIGDRELLPASDTLEQGRKMSFGLVGADIHGIAPTDLGPELISPSRAIKAQCEAAETHSVCGSEALIRTNHERKYARCAFRQTVADAENH
jgi:hypothetical protein